MSRSEQKVVQYLNEAHASEVGLVRVLQSQIAITPRGCYRTALETHLGETRRPRRARGRRGLSELNQGGSPLKFVGGVAQSVAGQALALGKTPFDLLRGSGGEEKVLKNAKDACATEALEIATYTAIERLARSVGDEQTAKLAASIRADEEKMLERIMRELPKLTDAVVGADVEDDPSYDVTKTGAADAVRATGKAAAKTARTTGATAKRTHASGAQGAGRRAGRGSAQGRRRVASATSRSPATTRSPPRRSSAEARRALPDRPREGRLLRAQARQPHDGPRAHRHRCAATSRGRATTSSPCSELQTVLGKADDDRIKSVRTYERAHKDRAGVLKATERELATA